MGTTGSWASEAKPQLDRHHRPATWPGPARTPALSLEVGGGSGAEVTCLPEGLADARSLLHGAHVLLTTVCPEPVGVGRNVRRGSVGLRTNNGGVCGCGCGGGDRRNWPTGLQRLGSPTGFHKQLETGVAHGAADPG